ncbi:hypothetical protein BT69DRAFT_147541 [Atractiella rhizophila]|nr:hypothetical protein BT69DRAFT_147541 [Atractiella rhizophila]
MRLHLLSVGDRFSRLKLPHCSLRRYLLFIFLASVVRVQMMACHLSLESRCRRLRQQTSEDRRFELWDLKHSQSAEAARGFVCRWGR